MATTHRAVIYLLATLRRAQRLVAIVALAAVTVTLIAWHWGSLVKWTDRTLAYLPANATLLLKVDPEYGARVGGDADPIVLLRVSGRVDAFGRPAPRGTLRLSVEDIPNQHYLAGEVVEVTDGRFGTVALRLPAGERRFAAVQLRAEFSGLANDSVSQRVATANNSINIGFPRQMHPLVAIGTAGAVLLFAFYVISLFTGAVHTRKQRKLYSLMYFVVFFALILPVVVSVLLLQSQYAVAIMEKAPIGLVRATATSSKNELQWFLNIGGIVTRRDETTTSPRNASPGEAGVIRTSHPAATGSAHADGVVAPREQSGVVSTATRNSPYIEGGLAVPFYVILLSMFGAGINLTRRVPEIQEEFRGTVPKSRGLWRLLVPKKGASEDRVDIEQQTEMFGFRKALIQNFMYVLAAPFLATAVYYLVQLVATEPAKPVLVLAAFATGLISDTLVRRIINVTEQALKVSPEHRARSAYEAAVAQVNRSNAKMHEEYSRAREAVYFAEISRVRRDTCEKRDGAGTPTWKSIPEIKPIGDPPSYRDPESKQTPAKPQPAA